MEVRKSRLIQKGKNAKADFNTCQIKVVVNLSKGTARLKMAHSKDTPKHGLRFNQVLNEIYFDYGFT